MENIINSLFSAESQISLLPSNLIILVVALNVLGVYFKSNSNIKNEYIPLVLLALSCVCSVLLGSLDVVSFLQGIICWGIAIGTHQVYIQSKKLKNNK